MAGFLKSANSNSMLKEGHQIFDDPVLKNIHACRELTQITRTSLGPHGLCKLVINHIGKVFITHDASTIMDEMEVQHPAAKLLVLAAKAMKQEIGDGTNLVLSLTGDLLGNAQDLFKMGLHTADIIAGYQKARDLTLATLPKLVVSQLSDVRDVPGVASAIHTPLASKYPHSSKHLSNLVSQACVNVCPRNEKAFNVDNVRICKVEGSGLTASSVVHGFMILRSTEGIVKSATNAKVAVYSCGIDVAQSDTKGTVLIESADQLKDVSLSEERTMEKQIEGLVAAGVKVLVACSAFADLAIHYLDNHGIMGVKVQSRFELRRLASAVGATIQSTFDAPPTPEVIGSVDRVEVQEVADRPVLVFSQSQSHSRISTVLLRAPSQTILEDAERACNDGVNAYRNLCRDRELVAGGGAVELALAQAVSSAASTEAGLEQYGMRSYSNALGVIATSLAEVDGMDARTAVADLQGRHAAGEANAGIVAGEGVVGDVTKHGVLDVAAAKTWAVRLASDAAISILRVHQIIMSKQAGGPNPNRRPTGMGDD